MFTNYFLAQTNLVQFSIDCDKKFLNRGFHDNSSNLTQLKSGFLGRLRTTYH